MTLPAVPTSARRATVIVSVNDTDTVEIYQTFVVDFDSHRQQALEAAVEAGYQFLEITSALHPEAPAGISIRFETQESHILDFPRTP